MCSFVGQEMDYLKAWLFVFIVKVHAWLSKNDERGRQMENVVGVFKEHSM